jgi:hypothetical protein
VSWSLALTRPQTEFAVSRAIQRWWPEQKHIVFRVRKRIVCRGKVREVERPAWPRYLFLHEVAGIWGELRGRISAISDFVREGQRIALLPDPVVTSLLAASSNGVLPSPDLPNPRFRFGDQVVVRNLPGLPQATFQQFIDEDTAIVLLPWLGAERPATVCERDLMPFVEVKPREAPRRKKRHRRNRRKRSDASGSLVTING